jgi:hypothetical protein
VEQSSTWLALFIFSFCFFSAYSLNLSAGLFALSPSLFLKKFKAYLFNLSSHHSVSSLGYLRTDILEMTGNVTSSHSHFGIIHPPSHSQLFMLLNLEVSEKKLRVTRTSFTGTLNLHFTFSCFSCSPNFIYCFKFFSHLIRFYGACLHVRFRLMRLIPVLNFTLMSK